VGEQPEQPEQQDERMSVQMRWRPAEGVPVYGLGPNVPPPDLQQPWPPTGADNAPPPAAPAMVTAPPIPHTAAAPGPVSYHPSAQHFPPLFYGPVLTPEQRHAQLPQPPPPGQP